MIKRRVCICGGGNLGHVVAAVLSTRDCVEEVTLLTTRPQSWSHELSVQDVHGFSYAGIIGKISSQASEVIPAAHVVLLCLPGNAIVPQLEAIKPYLTPGTMVGSVFSSTGFFFEALDRLPSDVPLWGFQRVPYIARTIEYGHSAKLMGYKNHLEIAVERNSEDARQEFCRWVERAFGCRTSLLANYLEASLTNSNPLLHTSRLFTMFGDWHSGVSYPRNFLFYEEWTEEAAQLYIQMDQELFRLLDVLPVTKGFLPTALDYYESVDAVSLKNKLSSIAGFKGILSPMCELEAGKWVPDFSSRYFTEDFGLSLRYIWQLVHKHGINAPHIDMVYMWGSKMIGQ